MNKKHFIAVAAEIRSQLEHAKNLGASTMVATHTVRVITSGLSNVFARQNPRFDRERFLAACGIE